MRSRSTINCVICGGPATNWTGHVHLPDGKKILSGLCDEHANATEKISRNGGTKCTGCYGNFFEWMGDSKERKAFTIKELTEQNKKLRNDLLDALDLKNGKGPTAWQILNNRNKELQAEIDRLQNS